LGQAAKVLIRVLTKRIEAKANAINHIGKDQFGFRKGKGTRDTIAMLRVLGERSLQRGKDLCICFVDYEKAFDRVDWRKMMCMLKDIGVDWRDRNLIAKLYLGLRAVVRIDGELSGYCIIGQGVRQGCPLSPLLLNLYIQYVINKALEDIQEGVKVGGVLIPAIRFADDQAMVSHTVRGLQVMDALQDTTEKYNMRINTKKTKIMRMSTVEGRTMNYVCMYVFMYLVIYLLTYLLTYLFWPCFA